MPDDSIAHAIRLSLWASKLEDQVARYNSALEFKRQVCRRKELLCSADVVQQARQSVRLDRRRVLVKLPLWKMRLHECGAVDEDAVAVVEGLLIELFLIAKVSACPRERHDFILAPARRRALP